MKTKHFFFLPALISMLSVCAPLFSQELDPQLQQRQAADEPDSDIALPENAARYSIESVSVEVTGNTRRAAVVRFLELDANRRFRSIEELSEHVDTAVNRLSRTGYFVRGSVRYELEEIDTEFHQRVIVYLEDQGTNYIVPYPYYSTDGGWGINARLKMDNFLGLLFNTTFGAGIKPTSHPDNLPDIEGYVDVSGFNFDTFSVSGRLFHSFNPSSSKTYHNTYLKGNIRFPLRLFDRMSSSYSAYLTLNANYAYQSATDAEISDVPHMTITPGHSFSISRTRGHNNFTTGFSASLSNSFTLNTNTLKLSGSLIPTVRLYSYTDLINFRGRFTMPLPMNGIIDAVFDQDQQVSSFGDYLRGVRSSDIKGNWGIFLNMSAMIRVFEDETFGSIFVEPFFDIGWAGINTDFSFESMCYSSGFDLSWRFRSLTINFSWGMNLSPDVDPERKYEVSIKTSRFF